MTGKVNEFPEGTIVGAWKIQKFLGRGGQGAVWAVKPIKTKHTPARALKVCFAADEKGRARFESEVALMKKCDTPYIGKIFDEDLKWTERVSGVPAFAFFVTEKCDGSLSQRTGGLGDTRNRLKTFCDACESVSYLHALAPPIIHRDIKPDNFLLAAEPVRLLLADFGIAREGDGTGLTATEEVVGSQFFRAPEILNRDKGTVRSDVYSLGRVLEWLLTGEVSKDMGSIAVPRGGELDDHACEVLDRIIAKATHVRAADRFASVRELSDALPDLWLTVKPRTTAEPAVATPDAEVVLPAALDLARARDQIGWRRLEQQVRRSYPEQMKSWRAGSEPTPPKNKEQLFAVVDDLLHAVGGRLAFALAGIYSQDPAFLDQRRVVSDLVALPDWSPNGRKYAVRAPRGVVYLYHHLHGALCCDLGRYDLAIQLAETPLVEDEDREPRPLFRLHGQHWPTLLDNTSGWEYLLGVRMRFKALQDLFALQSDFDAALTTYSMLLSLLEAGYDAKRMLDAMKRPDFKHIDSFDVPPRFLEMNSDLVRAGIERTFANSDTVQLILRRTGASKDNLAKVWPTWRDDMLRWHRIQHKWGDPYDKKLGDLRFE
jgi:serine/threonine protein kinase